MPTLVMNCNYLTCLVSPLDGQSRTKSSAYIRRLKVVLSCPQDNQALLSYMCVCIHVSQCSISHRHSLDFRLYFLIHGPNMVSLM